MKKSVTTNLSFVQALKASIKTSCMGRLKMTMMEHKGATTVLPCKRIKRCPHDYANTRISSFVKRNQTCSLPLTPRKEGQIEKKNHAQLPGYRRRIQLGAARSGRPLLD